MCLCWKSDFHAPLRCFECFYKKKNLELFLDISFVLILGPGVSRFPQSRASPNPYWNHLGSQGLPAGPFSLIWALSQPLMKYDTPSLWHLPILGPRASRPIFPNLGPLPILHWNMTHSLYDICQFWAQGLSVRCWNPAWRPHSNQAENPKGNQSNSKGNQANPKENLPHPEGNTSNPEGNH